MCRFCCSDCQSRLPAAYFDDQRLGLDGERVEHRSNQGARGSSWLAPEVDKGFRQRAHTSRVSAWMCSGQGEGQAVEQCPDMNMAVPDSHQQHSPSAVSDPPKDRIGNSVFLEQFPTCDWQSCGNCLLREQALSDCIPLLLVRRHHARYTERYV